MPDPTQRLIDWTISLSEKTTPASSDLILLTDMSGTPASKKTTVGDLFASGVPIPNVYGSIASGGDLHLYSTSHATKGKIYLGANSYFDELNSQFILPTGSIANPSLAWGSHPTVGIHFEGTTTLVLTSPVASGVVCVRGPGQIFQIQDETATGRLVVNADINSTVIALRGNSPNFDWSELDATVNNKVWKLRVDGEIMSMNLVNDDESVSAVSFQIIRGENIFNVSNPNINVGVLKVFGKQVVGQQVVDAKCDDAINAAAWDATTAGVLTALRDAMVTHGLVVATGSGPNLVSNGTMETGSPPTGWTIENTPSTFERSGVQKHSLNYSAHVIDPGTWGGFYQSVAMVNGKTYTLSYSYYIVSGGIAVQTTATYEVNNSHTTIGSWQDVETEFLCTGSDTIKFINISNSTPAEFYIDDVSIEEVL